MSEQDSRIVLEHYSQISDLLSKDLSWYIVYEAALQAGEALHIEGDLDLPDNKRRLYNYAISVELSRLIEEHVLPGYKVEITHPFYREAMDYFALHVPSVPTFELSSYLNYLDSWAGAVTDWTTNPPAAYDNLDIVISHS